MAGKADRYPRRQRRIWARRSRRHHQPPARTTTAPPVASPLRAIAGPLRRAARQPACTESPTRGDEKAPPPPATSGGGGRGGGGTGGGARVAPPDARGRGGEGEERWPVQSSCGIAQLPDKFGGLLKLSFLNLSGCSKLTKLPDNVNFACLEHLNLSSCHELENLPIDFGHLQKLEFMDLSGCYKVPLLPVSICQLNHLKHLDLSDCHNLKELPESFGHLFELEYLNLTSCAKFRLLPESICKLFKLRCLYLSYCLKLRVLPSSFGDLKLQILHMNGLTDMDDCPDSIGDMTSLTQFVTYNTTSGLLEKVKEIKRPLNLPGKVMHCVHEIKSGECSSIVDLVGLACSELILEGLQNVKHPEVADSLKLCDKSDIRVLTLCWENEGGEYVLGRLIPPRTLENFWLIGYRSNEFPDWMFDISSYLPFLSELTLDGLEACDSLPPFGALPNLRSISLTNIPNIRKIGKEFYGAGRPCMKLRVLLLELMENLVEWWTTNNRVK